MDDNYITLPSGAKILVGKYSLKEQNNYVNRSALEYMQRHPETTVRHAKKSPECTGEGKLLVGGRGIGPLSAAYETAQFTRTVTSRSK